MKERNKNQTPFTKPLVKSQINEGRGLDSLKQTDNGAFVIRERHFTENDAKYLLPKNYYNLDETAQRKAFFETAIIAKKIMSEISNYNINTSFHLVVGNNMEEKNTVFILTDVIKEVDITKDETLKNNYLQELTKTINGLVDYFIAKVSRQEVYLRDLPGWFQFVFGKKINAESDPKLYMVDADFKLLGNIGERTGPDNLFLHSLMRTMKKAEDLGLDLSSAKKKLFLFFLKNNDIFDKRCIPALDDYVLSWVKSLN